MKVESITQATDGQKKQIERFVSDAAAKALYEVGADKTDAQRIIENGNEVSQKVYEFTLSLFKNLSTSDKYKDEEVDSSYGYLSGYKPKGITEQTNRLRELFPGIGYANEKIAEGQLPQHAEGWFAIPKWQSVAPTYHEAVLKVLELIKNDRNGNFYNYREGQIDGKRLRETAKKKATFIELAKAQEGFDILVVPAQFGIRHKGRSVRRAREVFALNEYGLGAFEIGIMILTHPERLQHYDDLWIDCAGDEYDDPGSDDRFGRAPNFMFDEGRVEFGSRWFGDAFGSYGSASAFVPQES
ncbi:hypothetical protein H6776_03000 [Candidatus Nomurabacteria bacterium]|nr:hypothetical protein [Candidatus Nomurabacteria bacterium]